MRTVDVMPGLACAAMLTDESRRVRTIEELDIRVSHGPGWAHGYDTPTMRETSSGSPKPNPNWRRESFLLPFGAGRADDIASHSSKGSSRTRVERRTTWTWQRLEYVGIF